MKGLIYQNWSIVQKAAEGFYQGTILSEVIILVKALYFAGDVCQNFHVNTRYHMIKLYKKLKKHTQGWSNSCLMNVTSLNMLKQHKHTPHLRAFSK